MTAARVALTCALIAAALVCAAGASFADEPAPVAADTPAVRRVAAAVVGEPAHVEAVGDASFADAPAPVAVDKPAVRRVAAVGDAEHVKVPSPAVGASVADKPAIAAAVEKPPVRRVEGAPAPELVKEHHCIHDEPSHQAGIAADLKRNAHVVQRRTAAEERAFRAQAPQSIRIVLSTEDLTTTSQYCTATNDVRPTFSNGATTTCAASDVLTTAKRNLLVNTILPEALNRLAARISVNRLTSNLVVGSSCGDHTIPSAHSSTGVANADYVLYVSAGPIGGSTLAWAGSCQTESGTGRPIVGRANFDPEHLEYATASELEGLLDTAVHEILHALGISGGFFGANGRSSTTTKRGKPVTELDSTMSALLAEARSFTGCPTLSGVELEDEGSSGSAGSHFERRLYKDEIMTAAGGSKLSSFSLLALQDLGVGYTVNTAAAEPMVWGKATGCGFHTEKCNTAAGGAGTYFCFEASSSVQGCSFDKKSIGYCTVGDTGATLPAYFQYYSGEPTKGGTSNFMDACPYYQGYSNRNCTDADYDVSFSLYVSGNTYAADSRCHMATNLLRTGYSPASSGPRCLQTQCTSGGVVEFKVNGSAYQTCPSDGASVGSIPGYSGSVTCPVATEMCATFPVTTTTTAPAATTTTATPATTTTTTAPAATTTAAPGSPPATTTTAAPAPPPTTTTTAAAAPPVTTTVAPPTTTAAPAGGSSCDTSYLLTGNSPSPVLSIESINGILTEHNNARRTVSPPAATMPMLVWDQELANFAQEYMDGCPGMVHSTNAMRSNRTRFGFSYVGENLAAGTSSTSYGLANGGKQSTFAWNNEMSDWTYPMTCASGAVCGHYTQVIWAATTHVGCGYKYCASQPYKNYWSCVYGPGGNYVGQNPYPQSTGTPAACQVASGQPTPTPMPPTPPYTSPGSTAAPGTTPPPTTGAATTTTTTTAAPTGATGVAATTTTTTGAAAATSQAAVTTTSTNAASTTVPVSTTAAMPPSATANGTNGTNVTMTTVAPAITVVPETPAPTPPAFRRMIDGFIRIQGSFFAMFLNSTSRRALLRAAVRSDIARLLDVSSQSIIIVRMSLGSLRVNFTVTDDAASLPRTVSASPATAQELDARMSSVSGSASAAWLMDTSSLYATESTETLTVTDASSSQAQAVAVPPAGPGGQPASPSGEDDDSSCGAACVGFYVVVIAGVVLVVGAIAVVVVKVGGGSKSAPAKETDNDPYAA